MKTVVHVELFEKAALKLMGETRLLKLAVFLAKNAESGDLIQGTGGFRKIRFARTNEGKSGGFRIIYFATADKIYPVSIYAKNEKDNLTTAQCNQLRALSKIFKGV